MTTTCGHNTTFGTDGQHCENCGAFLNRFAVECDPTQVTGVADRLRVCGFTVYCEGVHSVLASKFDTTTDEVANALGSTWWKKDVRQLA